MPKLGMQPIRRRQLIDATLDAINEVGMHDATIAQIARRAGVSTGIISHYFKDKNGLLEATMRDITSQLRDAVLNRLHALPDGSASQRLQAIVGGNFDETQISSAAMKAWLAFWASSMHQPMLYRLQQVSSRRLLSNLVYEFRRELPREQAQEAGAETIAVPGWEHAWYAADADPYGGQLLVLQDGKEVWRIGYDGGQRLTDALDVFARA